MDWKMLLAYSMGSVDQKSAAQDKRFQMSPNGLISCTLLPPSPLVLLAERGENASRSWAILTSIM